MTGIDPRFPSRFQAGHEEDAPVQADAVAVADAEPHRTAAAPSGTPRAEPETTANATASGVESGTADAPMRSRPERVSRPVLLLGLLIALAGVLLHAGGWYLMNEPGLEVTMTDPETSVTYTTSGPLTALAWALMNGAAIPVGIGCATVVLALLLPVLRTPEGSS